MLLDNLEDLWSMFHPDLRDKRRGQTMPYPDNLWSTGVKTLRPEMKATTSRICPLMQSWCSPVCALAHLDAGNVGDEDARWHCSLGSDAQSVIYTKSEEGEKDA